MKCGKSQICHQKVSVLANALKTIRRNLICGSFDVMSKSLTHAAALLRGARRIPALLA
jgi:hypothetical protein